MAKVKKEKQKKEPELYWQDMVSVFFNFTKEKYHDVPTFDGSSPRDLKAIVTTLRTRCESSGHEWTYEAATGRLRMFLEHCYADNWLRANWLLRNLNSQKDRIFFSITRQYLSR
jgi:hypothetical protein